MGTTLAATHATSSPFTGDHRLWLFFLAGLAAGRLVPTWLFGLLAVVAVIGTGVLQVAGRGHVSAVTWGWLLAILVAWLVGHNRGRIRALRHLGIVDFRRRLSDIRSVSRW